VRGERRAQLAGIDAVLTVDLPIDEIDELHRTGRAIQ